MEVILLERIAKLGQMGETVKVRDGFARNYLLPLGKALRANAANKARFESERSTLEARNLERKSEAQKVADSLTASPSSSSVPLAKPASFTARLPPATSSRRWLPKASTSTGTRSTSTSRSRLSACTRSRCTCTGKSTWRLKSTLPVRPKKPSARPRAKA